MMHLSQDIRPISYLKSRTADVVNHISEHRRPVIITQNGEAKAVIQDIRSYENLQNTINLLKLIVQSEQAIEQGRVVEQSVMFDAMERDLFGS
jgi:prevent-host-death family protein